MGTPFYKMVVVWILTSVNCSFEGLRGPSGFMSQYNGGRTMYRKVLSATLAVVFIVSLCFSVYNQAHAGITTCSASASAGVWSSSASVSPGLKSDARNYSVGTFKSGSATVKAHVNGETDTTTESITVEVVEETREKFFAVGASIQVPGTIIASVGVSGGTKVSYKTRVAKTKGASESNHGMPSSRKWGSANGSIDGASDSAWAEYHSSGYYN